MTHKLWDLLFPWRCVVCGRLGVILCPACGDGLPRLSMPVCQRCGAPGAHRNSSFPCPAWHWQGLTAARSTLSYRAAARTVVLRFKNASEGRARALAQPLGDLLYSSWQAYALAADCLVPVPLDRAAAQRRGYNQALLLAEALSARSAVPLKPTALTCTRPKRPQKELPAAQRRDNVAGAFACSDPSIQGQRILLIDDVTTTSATLDACARELRKQGARSVWGLTLAQTVLEEARKQKGKV